MVGGVGYGTQKRKDLTGSVAQVKSADLLKNSSRWLRPGLQGKMAGVQVTNNSGEPEEADQFVSEVLVLH